MEADRWFQSVAMKRHVTVVSTPPPRAREDIKLAGVVLAIGWWTESTEGVTSRGAARRPGFDQPVGAGGPELLYLVSDASQPAPVWVSESQIVEHKTESEEAAPPPPAPAAPPPPSPPARPDAGGGTLGKVSEMLERGARRRTQR